MNARLYDPQIGSFLSPDPFVQSPDFSQSFNRYSYCLNNPLKYTDPDGEIFGIDDIIVLAAFAYFGGIQANFAYAASHGTNPFNPGNWNWGSANTYFGIAGGALGGVNALGYNIPYIQVPGMIPNGALQAGIQVTLNGIGNLTDDRKFFDNWYWSAGMGFATGAISGYGLAKEKGLNYWWGNKNAYNRTSWSFYNVDKPDYVVDFGIPNVGSKSENDCAPTTGFEIETKRKGSRSYDDFVNNSGYVKDKGAVYSQSSYESYMHNTHTDIQTMSKKDYHRLFNAEYMQNAADNGEIFSFHFLGHVDNVRYLDVYINAPMKNTLIFRQSQYNFSTLSRSRKTILNIFHLF
jgi:hypothetical protein